MEIPLLQRRAGARPSRIHADSRVQVHVYRSCRISGFCVCVCVCRHIYTCALKLIALFLARAGERIKAPFFPAGWGSGRRLASWNFKGAALSIAMKDKVLLFFFIVTRVVKIIRALFVAR